MEWKVEYLPGVDYRYKVANNRNTQVQGPSHLTEAQYLNMIVHIIWHLTQTELDDKTYANSSFFFDSKPEKCFFFFFFNKSINQVWPMKRQCCHPDAHLRPCPRHYKQPVRSCAPDLNVNWLRSFTWAGRVSAVS